MNRDNEPFPSGKAIPAGTVSARFRGTAEARRIEVEAILAGEREVVLMHNGEAYRLRITANNKLILTK